MYYVFKFRHFQNIHLIHSDSLVDRFGSNQLGTVSIDNSTCVYIRHIQLHGFLHLIKTHSMDNSSRVHVMSCIMESIKERIDIGEPMVNRDYGGMSLVSVYERFLICDNWLVLINDILDEIFMIDF